MWKRPDIVCTFSRWFEVGFVPSLLLGCGAASLPSTSPPAVQPVSCSDGASRTAAGDPPSCELHLRPLPEEAGGAIAVRMVLTAPEGELSSLRPPAGLQRSLQVRMSLQRPGCDPATGEPPLERRVLRAEPGAALNLGTSSASRERVRLELEYQLDAVGSSLLNANRFLAEGRQLFFLPDSPEDVRAETLVGIDTTAYGHDGRGASSIGLGSQRRAPLTQRAMAEAVFVGGYLGSAEFLAPEGEDRTVWFGSPPFDPRSRIVRGALE